MTDETLQPGDVVCFKADVEDPFGPMTVGSVHCGNDGDRVEVYWLTADYELRRERVPPATLHKLAPEPAGKWSLFSRVMRVFR